MNTKNTKPNMQPPVNPTRTPPSADWEHFSLWQNVRDTLAALPLHFRSDTFIEGIHATDIFTLNSALGATIENQVVETLNQIRTAWDPAGNYQSFGFIRQPQTFPDVVFKDMTGRTSKPLFGIELKGWYLLAKEGEPSLRFTQTPDACAEADMIVVVPWVLGNVISGRPKVYSPFVESARYAAEFRNDHWQHLRKTQDNTGINIPSGISPYPSKSDASTDKPVSDKGGNFGRIARTGIMDGYMARLKNTPICGINAEYWLEFFKVFQQDATEAKIHSALAKLRQRVQVSPLATPRNVEIVNVLDALEKLWMT